MLSEKNVILLVIDFQEKLVPHISGYRGIIDSVRRMIKSVKLMGIPLIVTEQYPKGLGITVSEIASVLDGELPVEKESFSCCAEPEFIRKIETSGKSQVLISGIETHICVYQTCLDLKARGYEVELLTDCTGSRKETDKKTALLRLYDKKINLTSSEMALFELLRSSKHPFFKEISAIIK